ncbi:uncharacterized protein ACLA_032760 [Aspergillus clavatus NRRL 1]|uniref:Integral membrane protein n=1 Tax=Aspergillus clavatus (strain ATCC 1007 / CBS 513.65 / DSM 816 / NCTC 3887 / NRRL 1 / QM 1276 / 107) TaxID=344612 RepID=A1CSB9_ASPCL|nr:uncharacterized protein ACLA_032760 [Aspergillus clavatus NRRL 1]EAW08540.1 integral membrane protein [Aspergillus clavatus NRRL 1]
MAYGRLAWTANNAVLNSTCRLFHLIAIVLVFTTAVFAADDSILPSAPSASFPQCGLSCPQLNAAADSCLASPDPAHSVHVSCFCQSSLIAQLHNVPDGTCDDTCTQESDRVLLKTWYNNYCSSGGAAETTTTAAVQPAAATTGSSSTGQKAQPDSPAPKSWWDGHYQWVIMVIVLIVAFSVIAAVGVWVKKRHDAKHPNLYHGVAGSGSGSGTGSGLFASRAQDQSPAPSQPGHFSTNVGAAPPSRYSSGQSESIASSSRTDVVPSKVRSGMSSTRLQKTPELPNDGDVEIREVPR